MRRKTSCAKEDNLQIQFTRHDSKFGEKTWNTRVEVEILLITASTLLPSVSKQNNKKGKWLNYNIIVANVKMSMRVLLFVFINKLKTTKTFVLIELLISLWSSCHLKLARVGFKWQTRKVRFESHCNFLLMDRAVHNVNMLCIQWKLLGKNSEKTFCSDSLRQW